MTPPPEKVLYFLWLRIVNWKEESHNRNRLFPTRPGEINAVRQLKTPAAGYRVLPPAKTDVLANCLNQSPREYRKPDSLMPFAR
ncbi:hypothetical protein F6P96_08140 [Escherichia coli]|nr:hypothetical protein F6P96_08140 [Escherichia coli]